MLLNNIVTIMKMNQMEIPEFKSQMNKIHVE